MIPDIGMMVGAYIFTRMISVLAGPDATGAWTAVEAFCAFITMVITVVAVYDLVTRGASIPPIR